MQAFQEMSPYALEGNVFQQIGKDWMLVAARRGDEVNMLTASWGGMGILWNKPVVFTFLRPQRYTREFVDSAETFSLSFFGGEYRDQLNLCGSQSGRDIDKVAACGFDVLNEGDTPYFAQAGTVLICRKLYVSQLADAEFHDPSVSATNYPAKDFHHVYVGEVLKALVK